MAKKKNTLRFIITGFLLLAFSVVQAQKGKLEQADKMFDRYAFIDAREIYLEVAEKGYESENLFKKLGDSYYFNNDLKNARKWYEKLYEFNEEQLEKDYLFRYAMALKSEEEYQKSDEILLKYDRLNVGDSASFILKDKRNYLELIEMQSGKFEVALVEFNSKLSDFSPQISEDELIFASNRENPSSVKRIHEWNKQPYLELYSIALDTAINPQGKPKLLPDVINSKFHEASACLTKDKLTIYFTRNNYNNKKYGKSEEGINFLKIYRSTRKSLESDWEQPEELPFNSDDYSVAHPVLNSEENKLYFVSDMPGTLGESDIFVVDLNSDGSFGTPQNLGKKVNTIKRETFPFINAENQLFFSSNGHVGLGGLDIFVSEKLDDGEFGDAVNVGRPLNSPIDDFCYVKAQSKEFGFLASNREGGLGEDDIYRFEQTGELITKCQQYVSGTITDTENEEPIEGVTVELYDEDLNLLESMKTAEDGKYKFTLDCDTQYVLRASKENFKSTEESFKSGVEFEKNFRLPSVEMEKGDDLGVTRATKGEDLRNLLQLDPIYFDLDKANIRPDAEVELQKVLAVLKKYPTMKIDIRSHTDSRAGDQYNLQLSERRAKSTVAYLVKNGIAKNRVSGKGYGETQLVNNCGNNSDCTEAQHQLNRRSEFIILNENETPEEIREKILDRIPETQMKKEIEKIEVEEQEENGETRKYSESTSSIKVSSDGAYDFEAENPQEVYTVQIAADYGTTNILSFPDLSGVYMYDYADGYKRYYIGQFDTKNEANLYKRQLRRQGYADAFVVGLRGKARF